MEDNNINDFADLLDQPLDPVALIPYTVQITDEWETSDGCGFTGDLFFGDVQIASFENLGDGGCNKYLPVSGERERYRDFIRQCEAQFPDKSEPADYVLIYLELRDA